MQWQTTHLASFIVLSTSSSAQPHYFYQERCLRATQYLPDIVKLQRSLYDAFHHRMDRKEAKMTTFGEYLKNVKNGKAFALAE